MKNTKKFIALLLAAVLIFSLCACGKKDEEETSSSDSFDFSSAFDDNGYWKDITALDYVTLCDYSSYEVSDEDIENAIAYFQAYYPDSTENYDSTREIADGDTVNIDYVGYIDGVAFEGGDTEGSGATVTIGYTQYIDDFLDQLIGHKPGDQFDIEVTFPDDYGNEELNGKDAVFKTTVNYVVDYELAELTDEFVSTNLSSSYGWTTVDEMKAGVEQELFIEYINENSTIADAPQSMLDYLTAEAEFTAQTAVSAYQYYADNSDYDLETYLYYYTGYTDAESYIAAAKESVTEDAPQYLLYQAIAEKEGITITDKEVYASYAAVEDASASYDEMVEYYGLPFMKFQVLLDKVRSSLI